MKQISTFMLFAVLFSCSSVFAQKNRITTGLFFLPVSETKLGLASLCYYRSLSGNVSLGLKGMCFTDDIGAAEDQIRYSIANVDVVNRWTFAKARHRYKWNFEAGLSAAWFFKKMPPMDYWTDCISGMSTLQIQEGQKHFEEVLSKWHTERTFFTGIATGASWEFALSQYFGLGAGLTMNVYFSPKDGWNLLPMPNLNATYSF